MFAPGEFARSILSRPVHAPDEPPYRRGAIVSLIAMSAICITVLGALSDSGSLRSIELWLFVFTALVADSYEVELRGGTATMVDMLWMTGFAVLSVGSAAAFVLCAALASTLLAPTCRRSWAAALRLSTSLLSHGLFGLLGAVTARSIAHDLGAPGTVAASVLGGLVAIRVADYLLYPLRATLVFESGYFSTRRHLRSFARIDIVQTSIALPAALSLAYAYPHAPLLIASSAVPCVVVGLLARRQRALRRSERRLAELQTLIDIDVETGLANRDLTSHHMVRAIASAIRYGQRLRLALVELEGASSVWHDAAGRIDAARAITTIVRRSSDVYGRFGPNRFAVLTPCVDAEPVLEYGAMLRSTVARSVIDHGAIVSLCIASFDPASDPALEAAHRSAGVEEVQSQYASLGAVYVVASHVLETLVDRALAGLAESRACGGEPLLARDEDVAQVRRDHAHRRIEAAQ